MSYEALYRRWRPRVFEDILGQEYTITVLKNQIKNSNIAHAYLFTGIRGTGKTTTARIFARAVNCVNIQDSNPCNECDVCQGILTESILDVVEIDAASNNGVDNIRELREYAKFNPARGKYKIYIIDEVHMLSNSAFNAFLKVLEEPPSHVIFILATTNPERIPPTILSRCQRFDFKPVKTRDIIDHLSLICRELSIDYEEEAIGLIAINAGGGVRDALSILDRCIAFNDESLKYEDVIRLLGAVNYQTIFDLVEGIGKQDTSKVLRLTNEIFMEGKDPGQLMADLISHFRNLLFAKMDIRADELLALSEERLNQFIEQGKLFNINQLSAFIYTLSDIESKLRQALKPRVLVEVAVVSLCNEELNDSLEGLIERVKKLEKAVASGQVTVKKDDHKAPRYEPDKKAVYPAPRQSENIIKSRESEGGTDRKQDKNHGKPKDQQEEKPGDRGSDLKALENAWGQILGQMIRDKKAPIEALLKEGTIERLEGDRLTISLKEGFEFHRDRLDKEEVKNYISSTIEKFIGKTVKPSFVMEGELTLSGDENRQEDPVEKLKETLPGEIFDIIEIIDE